MLLCIGPTGSGKTSLINLISSSKTNFGLEKHLPITAPTVGTNLTTLHFTASIRRNNAGIVIRELGGAMAQIWPKYFKDCRGIVFVADSSDIRKLAAISVLLMTSLKNQDLTGKPVALIFNKSDLWRSPAAAVEFKWLLRLEDIMRHSSQKITVVDMSVKNGTGLQQIREWLIENGTG